jgi:high-affinity Fe2+/Pb2+ permease
MFKDAKTKKIALIVIAVVVLALIIWYFFIRKDKNKIVINLPDSSFDDGISPDSL